MLSLVQRKLFVRSLTAPSCQLLHDVVHREVKAVITKFDADAPISNKTSSGSADGTAPEGISKRKAFKAIKVDNKLLAYLDSRNLGMERKQAASKRKRSLIERGLHDVHSTKVESDAAVKRFDVPKWAIKKLASAKKVDEIPPATKLPEVAFVGRSNVGKSTLLNAILGLKGHPLIRAATSPRPGETRSCDFYRLGKGAKAELIMVDTPGFGFAFAKEDESDVFLTTLLMYLRGRGAPLKRVCLLVDARHGFKFNDVKFMERLYARKGEEGSEYNPLGPYKPPKLQVILTKCDLVLRKDLVRRVTQVREQLNEVTPRETLMPVLMVSALKDNAVEDIQKELAGLAPQRSKPKPETSAEGSSEPDADGSFNFDSSSRRATAEASDAVEVAEDAPLTKTRQRLQKLERYSSSSSNSNSSSHSRSSSSTQLPKPGRGQEQYATKHTGAPPPAAAAAAPARTSSMHSGHSGSSSKKGYSGTRLMKHKKRLVKDKMSKRRR